MREALARHVPAGAVVASQNNINSSPLAHRALYLQFPSPAAFVVVDTSRPMFVFDRIDPEAFVEGVRRFRRERRVLHESGGFVIFGPPGPDHAR